MAMTYYETMFVNKRKSTVIIDEGGKELLRLEPGQSKFVESRSAGTSYAKWLKITYTNDGVKLEENPAWRWPGPPDQLMLTIINLDGAQSEMFHVGGGEPVICYKNIPRYVSVPYWDAQWRFIERLEIKNVESTEHKGDYVVRKKSLQHVRTMRPRKEIKAIQEKLLNEASAEAKKKLKLMFAAQRLPEE